MSVRKIWIFVYKTYLFGSSVSVLACIHVEFEPPEHWIVKSCFLFTFPLACSVEHIHTMRTYMILHPNVFPLNGGDLRNTGQLQANAIKRDTCACI